MFGNDFETFVKFWFVLLIVLSIFKAIRNHFSKKRWNLKETLKYLLPLLIFGILSVYISFNPVDNDLEYFVVFLLILFSIIVYKNDAALLLKKNKKKED